jgi:hypothetical protein
LSRNAGRECLPSVRSGPTLRCLRRTWRSGIRKSAWREHRRNPPRFQPRVVVCGKKSLLAHILQRCPPRSGDKLRQLMVDSLAGAS